MWIWVSLMFSSLCCSTWPPSPSPPPSSALFSHPRLSQGHRVALRPPNSCQQPPKVLKVWRSRDWKVWEKWNRHFTHTRARACIQAGAHTHTHTHVWLLSGSCMCCPQASLPQLLSPQPAAASLQLLRPSPALYARLPAPSPSATLHPPPPCILSQPWSLGAGGRSVVGCWWETFSVLQRSIPDGGPHSGLAFLGVLL